MTKISPSFMIYERFKHSLAPKEVFYRRLFLLAFAAVFISMTIMMIGVWGYPYFEKFSFVDAWLNASMIFAGMGSIADFKTDDGKLFASFYALFASVIYVMVAGILIAPICHRFLHKLHLEDK